MSTGWKNPGKPCYTVALKLPVALLPAASVAVQITDVGPAFYGAMSPKRLNAGWIR